MYFLEDSHQYIIRDKEYKSFSYLKKLVEPYKDWDKIAETYAKKNKMTKEEVLKQWEEKKVNSCERGTLLHLYKEDQDKATGEDRPVYFSEVRGDKKIIKDLKTLEDGWHLELCMYNHEYEACGTADKVFIETIDGVRYVDVYDYKGLSLDTDIFTTEGWKTIGEIKEGDFVFDGEGNPTEVEHVSSVHNNPCYKITFDSGESIICDHEHKWELTFIKRSQVNYKNIYSEYNETMTSEEIFNNFSKLKKFKRPRIACTNIILPDKNLPIDPYVLGLWLGDGNRCAGTITCVNDDIWEEILKRGYKTSINHNRKQDSKAESRTLFNLFTGLSSLNLLKNKHIPEIYKLASHKQRLDLLRGFMDADGYFNRSRNRCVATTTREWQALAISELASSLGMKPTIIKAFGSGFGKKDIPKFDVCFSPKENPFLIRNKDYNQVLKDKRINLERAKFRYITSIEKVETVPTKCLAVKSDCHTYLVTKSFIKTHNTNEVISQESFYNPRTKSYEMMTSPLNHIMNSNYWGYALQLSTYGYFMERYGYTVRKLQLIHVPLEEVKLKKEEKLVVVTHDNKKYKIKKEVTYEIDYLKKEVVKLLNYFKYLKLKNRLPEQIKK